MSTPRVNKERFYRQWAAVEGPVNRNAGRARLMRAWQQQRAQSRRSRGAVWITAGAIAAAASVAVWVRPSPSLSFKTPSGQGEVGAWLATDKASEMPLAFSEKTEIVLRRDSRGRVERVGKAGAHFLLERGSVHAHVVHRDGTDWRFLAGPFEVRVTGTELNVAWDPSHEQFTVHVDNGAVVVHGPYLGSDQVVHAGEQCTVDVPSKSMRFATGSEAEAVSAHDKDDAIAVTDLAQAPAPPAAAAADAPRPTAAAPGWTKLEEVGDYDGAYAVAQKTGVAALCRSSSADALLELAKVGQLSGHVDMQRDALMAIRRRFAGTHQAALAAYELGRNAPAAEAATWFASYLAEQPNGPLAREASGRLLEAYTLAHDEAAARDVAMRYLSRYPGGPHAALARRALEEHGAPPSE